MFTIFERFFLRGGDGGGGCDVYGAHKRRHFGGGGGGGGGGGVGGGFSVLLRGAVALALGAHVEGRFGVWGIRWFL